MYVESLVEAICVSWNLPRVATADVAIRSDSLWGERRLGYVPHCQRIRFRRHLESEGRSGSLKRSVEEWDLLRAATIRVKIDLNFRGVEEVHTFFIVEIWKPFQQLSAGLLNVHGGGVPWG